MKLFFDECVSPGAAIHFRDTTEHAAAHPRDNGLFGVTDPEILDYCIQIDHVLITVNGKDFRKLCGVKDGLHPGLIIIPSVSKENQIKAITLALEAIFANAPPDTPENWMVNRVVEVSRDGNVTHNSLPA